MSGHTYPRTIDNGAGERLTFIRRVPGTAGDRLEVENVVMPGAGPPREEAMTVQQGRVAYQRPGEPARFAGPGETVVFKPGEPHKFWNAGEGELRVTGHIEPADNVEYLLTELYASMKQSGGAAPDPFDAVFLIRRYRGARWGCSTSRARYSGWCSLPRSRSGCCSASIASTPTPPRRCVADRGSLGSHRYREAGT